jgi:hypothetical protein
VFVPWPNDRFVRHLESEGHKLRQRLKLTSTSRLDPAALIGTYDNMVLFDLRTAASTNAADLQLLRADSACWSAMAFRMGEEGNPWLITWNPWHAQNRIRVSVMEEVSHIILGHKPTDLIPHPITGLPQRTFARSKEREAYGVAGAALVPFNGLVPLVRQGQTEASIAEIFGVSVELVTMRTNVTKAREAAFPTNGRPR